MIVVGGENLIDLIEEPSSSGNPAYRANPGGSPYNCAKTLGRLGANVGYLTPISADRLGDLLAEELKAVGVKLLSARIPEPSSLAVVSVGPDGQPSYAFHRSGTAERKVSSDALQAAQPEKTEAFQLGSLSITGGKDAEVWTEFFIQCKRSGVFTSLDPNVRPAFIPNRAEYLDRLDRLLAHTDLLKLSDEDLEWISPNQAPEAAVRTLLERSSAGLAVVTLGSEGAFALKPTGDQARTPAGTLKSIRDTVGAGDVFMGGLLAKLSEQDALYATSMANLSVRDLETPLRFASKAAALNCERSGCSPPTRGQLQANTLS